MLIIPLAMREDLPALSIGSDTHIPVLISFCLIEMYIKRMNSQVQPTHISCIRNYTRKFNPPSVLRTCAFPSVLLWVPFYTSPPIGNGTEWLRFRCLCFSRGLHFTSSISCRKIGKPHFFCFCTYFRAISSPLRRSKSLALFSKCL